MRGRMNWAVFSLLLLSLVLGVAAFNCWQLWGVLDASGTLTDPLNMYGKFLSCCFWAFATYAVLIARRVHRWTPIMPVIKVGIVWWFFAFNYVLDNFFFDPNKVQVNEWINALFTILAVLFTPRLTRQPNGSRKKQGGQ